MEEKKNNQNLFLDKDIKLKKQSLFTYLGAMVVAILSIVAVFVFASNNQQQVRNMNDIFLTELATSMTDKISAIINSSEKLLITCKTAVTAESYEKEDMLEMLGMVEVSTEFNNLYLSFDGEAPVDSNGNVLNIDTDLIYDMAQDGDVVIHSPMVDEVDNHEFFLMSTPIYEGRKKIAVLYAEFHLDSFASVLDLKSFGGAAFFHLCEVDGTPLVLSGNSDNLFAGGDMYTFIGSLDMQNGHTVESIRADMVDGNSVLLKYKINGEERTATMVRVLGTDWCVVSIVLDAATMNMADSINSNTFTFSFFVVGIFSMYFIGTLILVRKNQRELEAALKVSMQLANTLQTSVETDALTKTFSRTTATEKISEIVKSAQQDGMCHAFVQLDIDNFKSINDTYGHQTGDLYLQEFVAAVKKRLRTGDVMGRLGGDEFIILLYNTGGEENAANIVSRIIESVKSVSIPDVSLDNVSLSAGVAMVPLHGCEYNDLSAKADSALYKAKNAGKGRFAIYSEC